MRSADASICPVTLAIDGAPCARGHRDLDGILPNAGNSCFAQFCRSGPQRTLIRRIDPDLPASVEGCQPRAMHHQRASIPFEPLMARAVEGLITNVDGPNLSACAFANAFRRDALVDDGVVVTGDIMIEDGGVVINLHRLLRWHAILVRTRGAEASPRHKSVRADAKVKAKAKPHGTAVIGEPKTRFVAGCRRQGRPTAVSAAVTPVHPGWRFQARVDW